MNVLVYIILLVLLLALAGVLMVACQLGLRWLLPEMAKRNKLVTFRTEGECKAIMRGETCVRWIVKVENYLIDPYDWDIFKGSLDNLKPYAKYLWEQAQGRSGDTTFEERKLKPKDEWANQKEPEFKPEFEKRLRKTNTETWFEKTYGVVWFGFPPYRLFTYKFRWIKYGQEEAPEGGKPSGNITMTARDQVVKSLYWHYTQYGIVIDDAKTGKGSLMDLLSQGKKGTAQNPEPQESENRVSGEREQVEVVFKLVIETETLNPQKTLFRTAGLSSAGEWLSALCNNIRDLVREWTTKQSWDSIIDKQDALREFLQDLRIKVNEGIPIVGKEESPENVGTPTTEEESPEKKGPEGVSMVKNKKKLPKKDLKVVSAERDYGQRILKINLISASLKDPTLQEELDSIFKEKRKVRQAQLKKEATIQNAKGLEATAAADGLGRAQGYKAIVESGGREIAMMEAIGAGGVKVLNVGGGGMGSIINLPESLTDEKPKTEKPTGD